MRERTPERIEGGKTCEYCGCPETFTEPLDSNCRCDCHATDPDESGGHLYYASADRDGE